MDVTQARILVGKQFGFSEEDSRAPANLSVEDRTKLLDYTFAYVAEHPEQFEPRQVDIAKRHVAAWGTNTPLNDTSFNWTLFKDEVGNNVANAVDDVASIGKGVLNLAGMGKWLIPVVGLSIAAIVVYKFYKAGDILPKLTK